MNTQENKSEYKFFVLLAVIYVMILILTMILENRVVVIDHIKILSGTLVIPLSYALSDVITEIYGYNQMRKLIWISILTLYLSASIIYLVMHLPTDNSNLQSTSYKIVLKPFLSDVITYSIAALVSIFLNSYLLSKWKILTSGKIFWLRSLGATMIGEFIFILVWGILGFNNKFPMHTLLQFMVISYICKIIYNLVAIIPTSFLVVVLRNAEGRSSKDLNVNFNPFILQD